MPARRTFCSRPRGAALVEFTLVALPLLFTGLAAIELGRWYLLRQAIGYALLEAGRAGSVAGASPEAILDGFRRGLAPMFPGRADGPDAAIAAVREAAARFQRRHGLPMARLDILSPAASSFDDFADPLLARELGVVRRVIDNSRLRHRGDTVGRHSRQSLHDANTLVLRVRYLHAPFVPGLRAVIRALPDPSDDYLRQARRNGLLAIVRETSAVMQSHPQEYPGQRTSMEPQQ